MPVAKIDGIDIHYETHGSGPALLMFAGGGFNSRAQNWSAQGMWKEVDPLVNLARHCTCIAYDRREAGASGGRVERLSWSLYVREARGLLDHLGFKQAFVMGGCMGVSLAIAFGVAYPERTLGMVLAQPAGGVRWRMTGRRMFAEHAAFAAEKGLAGVVQYAREKNAHFHQNALVGPWGWVVANNPEFALSFVERDLDGYVAMVRATGPAMFDRDTVPGADAEELLAIKAPAMIIPDDTVHHAPSGARYLRECLPSAVFHDVPPAKQTPAMIREWLVEFLTANSRSLSPA